MDKILAVLIFTTILVISFCSTISVANISNQNEMVSYSNEEHRFKLQHSNKLRPRRLLPYEVFHVGYGVSGIPMKIVSVYEMEGDKKLDLDGFFVKIKELNPRAKFQGILTEEKYKVLGDGTPATIYTFRWNWPLGGNRNFLGFQFCAANDAILSVKSAILIASKNGKHYLCIFTIRRDDKQPPEWLIERVSSFDFY